MSPLVLQNRLKWISRIVGLLVCIFFFIFALKVVLPGFRESGSSTTLIFIMLLSASVIGYVASWQWELPGAALQVICGISMFYFLYRQEEIFLGIVFGSPFIFTGVLLIYSWLVWKMRDEE